MCVDEHETEELVAVHVPLGQSIDTPQLELQVLPPITFFNSFALRISEIPFKLIFFITIF